MLIYSAVSKHFVRKYIFCTYLYIKLLLRSSKQINSIFHSLLFFFTGKGDLFQEKKRVQPHALEKGNFRKLKFASKMFTQVSDFEPSTPWFKRVEHNDTPRFGAKLRGLFGKLSTTIKPCIPKSSSIYSPYLPPQAATATNMVPILSNYRSTSVGPMSNNYHHQVVVDQDYENQEFLSAYRGCWKTQIKAAQFSETFGKTVGQNFEQYDKILVLPAGTRLSTCSSSQHQYYYPQYVVVHGPDRSRGATQQPSSIDCRANIGFSCRANSAPPDRQYRTTNFNNRPLPWGSVLR